MYVCTYIHTYSNIDSSFEVQDYGNTNFHALSLFHHCTSILLMWYIVRVRCVLCCVYSMCASLHSLQSTVVFVVCVVCLCLHTYIFPIHRCRKLPKGLKEWQAFNDLKQKIDDFNECCPLLELMANRSMKERHWERIANVTKHTFEVESETFSLRNIMEAPLLEHKEDIEDICISAVKEKDIEAKLKQVIADWSVQSLSFSAFKTRGELLLKGGETSEIISLMEDSLMVLSSLMSNRYSSC